MPLYEYQAHEPGRSCPKCASRFEVLQSLQEPPLSSCPECGSPVKKLLSLCRAAVVEPSEERVRVERRVKDYEREGMWSHAAELADKHAEKAKDPELRSRALDDYRKAGYNADTLAKHADESS